LALFKQVSDRSIQLGKFLVYTITLTNTTTLTPLQTLLTDTLPSGLEYTPGSLQVSQGTAQQGSDQITWADTITPGGVVTLSLQARAVIGDRTIFNSAVATVGNTDIYRTTAVSTYIEPARCYFPLVSHDYCRSIIDDFSNPASGWPIAETAYWSYNYFNGAYRLYSKQGSVFTAVNRGEQVRRFALEVDVSQASTVNGSLGILAWVADYKHSDMYTFEIYPATQEYAVFYYRGDLGKWFVWSQGTSNAIRPNPSSNRLRVAWISQVVAIDEYGFYINGIEVARHSIWSAPTPLHRVGLVATSDGPGFDARFDNYELVPDGCEENPQTSAQAGELPDAVIKMVRETEWDKR
jgi:uncharacterized repeat protein (TIGR01451 family)